MNYITLQNRIAKEVRYTETAAASGVLPEIKLAILDAVKFYESELFWFNEQQATAYTTAARAFYPLPHDFIEMDSVAWRDTSGRWDDLDPMAFSDMEEDSNDSVTRRPMFYCVYNEQLRLHPVPNDRYTLRMSYIKKLMFSDERGNYSGLTNDTDSNEWTDEVEPMIRNKAAAMLCFNNLYDVERAERYNGVADMWFRKFSKRTSQQNVTRQIRLQHF